jgi:hypothetical protein
MSLAFTSTKSVSSSGVVSIAAIVCDQPTPANTITLADYTGRHYGNVVDTPTLSSASYPPITNDFPKEYQLNISDKVYYDGTADKDTVILGYEYQLSHDHYDEGNPSGTVRVCYYGGDPVPNALYKLEYSALPLWEDYRDDPSGMDQRYAASLTWVPVPTGTTRVYRLRLLLSEDLCFTSQTYVVSYTKVNPHTGTATNATHTSQGWTEIINPKKLYTYGTDYTFSFTPDLVNLAGKLAGKKTWIQRSKLANISCDLTTASDREGWFLRVWCDL